MIQSGINLFLDLPVRELVEIIQEAERLGFNKYWVYDEGLITRDPYVTLTAAAQTTQQIQLGTGITNPYTRHPSITAASIATLDEFSNGRAFLGIGTGGSLTLDPLGIELKKPLASMREMITTSRDLFHGKTVTYDGQTVKLSSARIDYANADIPIWLAGRGPLILAAGGELADGVALDFVYKAKLGSMVETIHNGAAKSGNKPKICYSTVIVTSEETLNEVRPHMTYRLVNTPAEIREQIGLPEEGVEAIRKAMADGLEAAGKFVKDEWVRPFVIMGSIDECAAELKNLMTQHQMDEFLLPVLQTKNATRLMNEVTEVFAKI